MMTSQDSNGWPPAQGGPPPSSNEIPSGQPRQSGTFGPSQASSIQQPSSSQISEAPIVQQPGPFFLSQSNGHNIPTHLGLSRSQPSQATRGPNLQQQHSPTSVQQQHIVQHPGYSLPTLGPTVQQQQSPQAAQREYERERFREQQMQQELLAQQRLQQENEIINEQRERQREQQHFELQQREEQQRELQQREQLPSPLENHTGAITIQQPIASRVPATLHGPNGILNDQHPGVNGAPPQPAAPLGAPNGPGNAFSNGVQAGNEHASRVFPQHTTQPIPPQQLLGFSNAVTPQQLPNGAAALSQGQQPILNDALSYLDQVKVRFVHQPDVYNQFLDIMKDFKSQAIDTPGVIERVSSLFAGHPELIQGFNTFLPPGYRIECGTVDDPNAIRVTTPMGTTVSQMPSVQNRVNGLSNGVAVMDNARHGVYQEGPQGAIGWSSSQNENEASNGLLADNRRGHAMYASQDNADNDTGGPYEREDQVRASQAALLAHQQEQQGVSNLVSAVATNGAQGRHNMAQVSPGGGQITSLGQAAAGLSNAALTSGQLLEKRGPVEFNHAIGYVNKIKNRFSNQPEIYKQFLEILQTYQRESKPIQDVYAQVTQLFGSAPDLLEDFKQFLPESAAQAKAQAAAKRQATEDAAMLSNVRGDFTMGQQHAQVHTPRPEMNMPPVGNFAPPSATKENKKRRGGPGSQMTGGAAAIDTGVSSAGQNGRIGRGGPSNKRTKVEQPKPTTLEAPPVSPSLVPSLPSPMPPSKDASGHTEQMAFFDRVKKFLSNKSTYNEFLKLCNLYTQDLLDAKTMIHKGYSFLGGNPELVTYLKNWCKYDGKDDVIMNEPRIPCDKVVLSNCRGLGPSYRLLPRRERLRKCGGRDQMCQRVLNDEWVSHPTWASEDSGFIAHRKNSHEESLHRIEEERHDYDINIEAGLRTIQLMEPIVQQMQMMSPPERAQYNLPPGIGGQSETIYQRVIKKIYGRDVGGKILIDMFQRPNAVLPIILSRLKLKVEEWKASQREWEKVWREQTNKIFWKSLDHQGIAAKKEDKRQFQPKTLHTEIQTKYEEQRRQRLLPRVNPPKYQLDYDFKDVDVIYDACHLMLTYLHYSYTGNEVDKTRLESFFTTFIPTFFDIDRDHFSERMSDIYDTTPPNEEVEEDIVNNDDSSSGRGRKAAGGRKSNGLLREVFGRGRHGQKEESVLESKETTPDQSHDEDTPASTGTPTENGPRVDEAEHRWMSHPSTGNRAADVNKPFARQDFHLYASLNIYCFFRVFQMLYERLINVKSNEEMVRSDVQSAISGKPAFDLQLIDKKPSEYFADTSPSANYYQQVITMCEDVLKGDEDPIVLEETVRRFYMSKGWLLFSFDKMLSSLSRFALSILVSDNKDKSLDIINLFYKDRKEDDTTHQAELTYRKQVEKLTKDGDIYRIRWNRPTKHAYISVFKKDEKTYEADELAATARWSYYISTFSMRDRTEGISLSSIQLPFLKRNMPPVLGDEEDYNNVYGTPQWNEDGLVVRIGQDNYHLLYDPGTCDWWVHNGGVRRRGVRGLEEGRRERGERFRGLFGERGRLVEGAVGEGWEEVDRRFKDSLRDGVWGEGDGGGRADGDEVMGGT